MVTRPRWNRPGRDGVSSARISGRSSSAACEGSSDPPQVIRVAVEVDAVDEAAPGEENLDVLDVAAARVFVDERVAGDDDGARRNLLVLDPHHPCLIGGGTGHGTNTPGFAGLGPLSGGRPDEGQYDPC